MQDYLYACKEKSRRTIFHGLIVFQFPNSKEKECTEILGNFIFRKWISPNFLSPEHNGIISDFQTNDETLFNLAEIAKV